MFKSLTLAAALLLAGNAFAAPVSYKIDANHTDVIAEWNHFGFSHPTARFGQVDGVIVYDAANVGQSSVKVTIPLSGLDTGVPALDEHLRSADFFEAEKWPNATFKSTKVEKGAAPDKLTVTGDLTIRDVTKPVVLDVKLNKSGEGRNGAPKIGFDATTSFNRSEFGVAKFIPNIADEVAIRITTEASVPQAAADATK